MNCTLYHDADIFAFRIRLYHLFIPLLLGRTKDPKSTRPSAPLKATFVTLYYLTPLILSPIYMRFRLC
jgi:hypothetical protein